MAISEPGTLLGQVFALAIKPARKAEPVAVASVEAVEGLGLIGDIHSDGLSPRQILLASRQSYEDLNLPFNSLRENLQVDFDTSTLKSGAVLLIGGTVRLWLTFQCEACGHLNTHRSALSREIGARRGMLARVLTGGVIHAGDAVHVMGHFLPEWSDDWRLRVARVMNAVPADSVIEYRQIARLAGVPSSYCRVFPRFLKTLSSGVARKAISLATKSNKPRWKGEAFFDIEFCNASLADQHSLPLETTPG